MAHPITDKGNSINTYTGNLRPAVVLALTLILIHITAAAIFGDEANSRFWLFNITVFTLYTPFFGVMAFQATQITITVYEKGIGWQRGGSHVFTTWDNIAAIGRKNEGDAATFGLYLHEQVQPDVSRWLDKRLFAAPVAYIRLIPTVTVPTTFQGREGNVIDMPAFAQTDFGQDISPYVPHLLET